jgi:RNA polymerase sigma factor (TIGR02999 family)
MHTTGLGYNRPVSQKNAQADTVLKMASKATDPDSNCFGGEDGSGCSKSETRDLATDLVESRGDGDLENSPSAEDLFPLVYDEMRRIAGSFMRRETPGHTLQPTALVHEAYLKLVDQTRASWKGRTHFLAVGARVMRRLLINHARDRAAVKRGRSWERVALTAALTAPGRELYDFDRLMSLNRAIERLAELDERQAAVVTMRFFAGLTIDEIAQVLDVSPRTINNDWLHARVWLFRELVGELEE